MTNLNITRDAFLANKVYEDLQDQSNTTFGVPGGDPTRFVVVDVLNELSSGAYGAVIHDKLTGDGIFVARGTDQIHPDMTEADLKVIV